MVFTSLKNRIMNRITDDTSAILASTIHGKSTNQSRYLTLSWALITLAIVLAVVLTPIYPLVVYRMLKGKFSLFSWDEWRRSFVWSNDELSDRANYGDSFGVLSATAGVVAIIVGAYNIRLLQRQMFLQQGEIENTNNQLRRREIEEKNRQLIDLTRDYDSAEGRERRKAAFDLIAITSHRFGYFCGLPDDLEPIIILVSSLVRRALGSYLHGNSPQTRPLLLKSIWLSQRIDKFADELNDYRWNDLSIREALTTKPSDMLSTIDFDTVFHRRSSSMGTSLRQITKEIQCSEEELSIAGKMIDGFDGLVRFLLMYFDLLASAAPSVLSDYLQEDPAFLSSIGFLLNTSSESGDCVVREPIRKLKQHLAQFSNLDP